MKLCDKLTDSPATASRVRIKKIMLFELMEAKGVKSERYFFKFFNVSSDEVLQINNNKEISFETVKCLADVLLPTKNNKTNHMGSTNRRYIQILGQGQ